ncbi:hypothetical protein QH948_10515 [Tessaracoccus lacteus]|uniref:General stress protein 17M-like domain-containing protein n=2 Tax=Tessaracoccus lacteus TaxID=3041766 RepID=A0ABY8PVW0_9ACTN|nr:general stress protein [Tessaracoccus sp. T21]WGT46575.1 hypothetical protein QH948_10515 [Tessaracoccus sp. T21]
MTESLSPMGKLMRLEFPQQVAEYPTYEEAQAAVDFLADQKFAIQNLMIVGSNLKMLERVTGRRTWGTVLAQGAVSGITSGLFVGLMLYLFMANAGLQIVWVGLAMGILFGVIASGLGYALSGGKRDFNSARQTVAATYEVLAEHKVAQEARDLLASRPGARAAMFE